MSKSVMGARVMFCGHSGWFAADIFEINGACAVKASGPVNGNTIIRKELGSATHHVSDFPIGGCWCPERGIFVVPSNQVKELK